MSATIFPTGVTIYNPEKCWSGYTILQAAERGALLIDMNGNEVRMWEGLQGFPNKMLPGGYVMGSLGERNPKYGLQDQTDLVQVDWDGNIVWKFDKAEYVEDPGEEPQWMARQHHDYQREGNTVGYYVPGSDPKTNSGNTLILAHKNVHAPAISDKMLLDDVIYEVDWDGDIVWEWKVSDHFEELGFDAIARNLMYRDPNYYTGFGNSHIAGDWVHTNSMSVLGPNKWYDAGDKRFHPDNIIIDCRDANIILIIEKATGDIVWKIGPDFDQTPRTAQARLDHRPASRPHDPARPARRRQHPHLRQRRLGRLLRAEPGFPHRHPRRSARLLTRAGNRPRHAGNRVADDAERSRIPDAA